ncbi:MAG: radical SAM protein [Alphaproteobacteria bacterium]|nr:radical SAM protein [Alphaproteobacteria bacterium]
MPRWVAEGLVLVGLDWRRSKDPRVSLGHASLLARLAEVPGLRVSSVRRAVNAPDFDRAELLDAVLAAVAGDSQLAVGVYVWNDAVVRWLLSALRRSGFTGRVILGGPQLSYAPAGVGHDYPEADVLIRGYGEDALAAVAQAEAPTPLLGVSWRGQAEDVRPAQVALSQLPSPILSGVLPVQPFMRWETQRGCVYRCSFCQHREPGARLRRHTLAPGRVADEINALVQGGASDIAVLDPIFNSNPDATAILRRFVERGYGGRLSLQSRFEQLDEGFLDACSELDVRLEFGLQTVQLSEMRAAGRINQLDRVEAAIEALHQRGLAFEVSLIYGLPTQTLGSFQDTLRWCQERGVPVLRAFPLMLLRGTALERERDRWGLVEGGEPIPVVVESDSFTHEEWLEMKTLVQALPG